jgi:hypothetical protein
MDGSSATLDGQVESATVETGSGDGAGSVASEGGETGAAVAPTWSAIFSSYLTMCKTCHIEMNSASSAYSWLQSQDFIDGAFSPLVSPAQSCLSWYGGDMPPGGTDNAAAVTEMDAWAAAGALNN